MAQELTGPIRDEPGVADDSEPSADRGASGVFRTRIVPLVALVLVAMIGLLAYSLFAPEDSHSERMAGSTPPAR